MKAPVKLRWEQGKANVGEWITFDVKLTSHIYVVQFHFEY